MAKKVDVPTNEGVFAGEPGGDTRGNLYQRILGVIKDAPTLEKNKRAVIKNQRYDYTPHDDVMARMRPLFVKHGISHAASMRESGKDGVACLVMKLINADRPDEQEVSEWYVPIPQHMGEKGVGAALSYALKYALMKTFLLGGQADLDEVETTEDAGRSGPDKKAPPAMPEAVDSAPGAWKMVGDAPPADRMTVSQVQAMYAAAKANKWSENDVRALIAKQFECKPERLYAANHGRLLMFFNKYTPEDAFIRGYLPEDYSDPKFGNLIRNDGPMPWDETDARLDGRDGE